MAVGTDLLMQMTAAHLFTVFSEILTSVHHDDKFSSENLNASLAKIKILPKVFVFSETSW